MPDIPQFLTEFLVCWHERDASGCAAFYQPEGEMMDPMIAEPIHGTDAIREYYENVWSETPDARLDPLGAAADEHGVVWMWRFSGTRQGQPWNAVGASYLRLVDGLVAWDHAVWDLSISRPEA
jgi:hypothetical protein